MLASDFRKEVILEENPGQKITGNGSAKVISYTPDKVYIQVSTNGNSLLFMSDAYTKDWIVKIDGKIAKIYRADYDFRAVFVPNGKHEVVFEYNSTAFNVGSLLALLGVVLILGSEVVRRRVIWFPKI
jgi:uncharacterized membrane protein YfhO